jgi:hypothetical protein
MLDGGDEDEDERAPAPAKRRDEDERAPAPAKRRPAAGEECSGSSSDEPTMHEWSDEDERAPGQTQETRRRAGTGGEEGGGGSSDEDEFVWVSSADCAAAGGPPANGQAGARGPREAREDSPTCGICLEPAGSRGVVADGGEAPAGPLIRLQMKMNARVLTCGHAHCVPCWAEWAQAAAAASAPATRDARDAPRAVRCPLCNAESPARVVFSAGLPRVPQAAAQAAARLIAQASAAVRTASSPPSPTSVQADQATHWGMRPLASGRQEQELRARAQRRRVQEEIRRDADELREYNEVKAEHGALAACYEYCRLRSQRFVAAPCREKVDSLQASLRAQVRNARLGADAACEAAVEQWAGARQFLQAGSAPGAGPS